MHEARVAAITEKLEAQLEQTFDLNARNYTLTELRGMDAAAKLGPEGEDAARIWDDTIMKHYGELREAALNDLRLEVRNYDAEIVSRITIGLLPESQNKSWQGYPSQSKPFPQQVTQMRAYRASSTDAICASLVSMPGIWAALYPTRQPFTFKRFGIDAPLLQTWCDARDREKQKAKGH
jgi:hypothetical protein